MEIDSFPVWVVSRVERTTVNLELITEDKGPRISSRGIWLLGKGFLGRSRVDESIVTH
jgi:hypothetical protein